MNSRELTDLHSQCMLPTCDPNQCCTKTRCRVLQEKAHHKQMKELRQTQRAWIRGLCWLCSFLQCSPRFLFVIAADRTVLLCLAVLPTARHLPGGLRLSCDLTWFSDHWGGRLSCDLTWFSDHWGGRGCDLTSRSATPQSQCGDHITLTITPWGKALGEKQFC